MRGIIAALALLGAAALSGSALAADTIAYQGRLASNSGGDPPSGTYLMKFSLYAFEGGGEPVWTETRSVPVEAGLYTVELGGVTAFADQLFANNPNLWLETALDSNTNSTFEESEIFSPRMKMTAAPYAFAGADGGTIGGGFDPGPNTPAGAVQRLGRNFEVGDGSISIGSLVSLYEDGKVRQSGSRLPFGGTEVPLPGKDDPSLYTPAKVRHVPLANHLFMTHFISLRQQQGSLSTLVAGRLDPENLSVEFGDYLITAPAGNSQMFPVSQALEDGGGDVQPLILSAVNGNETYYGATLSTIDPETLEITLRSSPVVTGVSSAFSYTAVPPISIGKIAESETNYTVLMAGQGVLETYMVVKNPTGNIPDVEAPIYRESVSPVTPSFGTNPKVLALPDGRVLVWSETRVTVYRHIPGVGLQTLGGFIWGHSGTAYFNRMLYLGNDRVLMASDNGFGVLNVPPSNNMSAAIAYRQTNPDLFAQPVLLSPDRFAWLGGGTLSVSTITDTAVNVSSVTSLAAPTPELTIQDNCLFVYRSLLPTGATTGDFHVRVYRDHGIGMNLGVALADAEKGEMVPVALDGIAGGLTGLTIGKDYYSIVYTYSGESGEAAAAASRDGTLSLTSSIVPVGRAISSTELLLRMN